MMKTPIPENKVLSILAQDIHLYHSESEEIMEFLENIGKKVGVTYRKIENWRVANRAEEKHGSKNEFLCIHVPNGFWRFMEALFDEANEETDQMVVEEENSMVPVKRICVNKCIRRE